MVTNTATPTYNERIISTLREGFPVAIKHQGDFFNANLKSDHYFHSLILAHSDVNVAYAMATPEHDGSYTIYKPFTTRYVHLAMEEDLAMAAVQVRNGWKGKGLGKLALNLLRECCQDEAKQQGTDTFVMRAFGIQDTEGFYASAGFEIERDESTFQPIAAVYESLLE